MEAERVLGVTLVLALVIMLLAEQAQGQEGQGLARQELVRALAVAHPLVIILEVVVFPLAETT
jgi:hypothetical protein